MIKLERTDVMNMENAIRGMRNPMNSWDKSDSDEVCNNGDCTECNYYGGISNVANCDICCHPYPQFYIGTNDLGLAQRLCNAGSDHRKFLRQIFVSVDITAPLYFWKEYDTYKVGTTANSCSTMHKIHAKEFTLDDFSNDGMTDDATCTLEAIIQFLEQQRLNFITTKNKDYWRDMIQLLPSSYNQLRTCTLTYENLRSMYYARKNHKLDEWHTFCEWVETLPYATELITGGVSNE